jgi:RNA polymerase primary sigma factor
MEADILRMRFGLDDEPPMTLREIGNIYSLSRERIRQIQERALRKLRSSLEDEGFEEAPEIYTEVGLEA